MLIFLWDDEGSLLHGEKNAAVVAGELAVWVQVLSSLQWFCLGANGR